jgi:glycosyltransferase involved in cell wall biosynthesis
MRIAILGTRGIPNHYGGFEQYAELLATYLVAEGWEVVVYNSSDHPYRDKDYKGVRIKHVYDPERKWGTVGQFFYDLGCILDTRKQKFDIVYQLGYTSSAVFNFLFPGKTTIVTNMDGLEWKRTKYNKWVQQFLRYSEKLAVKKSDFLVADSLSIQSYLKGKYDVPSFYSAYTATIPSAFDRGVLQQYGLEGVVYNLVIARLEPENNIEMIIDGHVKSNKPHLLLIIGNTETRYGKYLVQKCNSPFVKFLGSIYDKDILDSLRNYANLYFHGHSVGGTNPSLLEAMSCSCRIMAHDNEFNRGVLSENARYFKDAQSLHSLIRESDGMEVYYEEAKTKNLEQIANFYTANSVFTGLKEMLSQWKGKKK